ncbi:MAG: AAA family ATPase [Solirubrobacteraceae bacterium]|jgi:chromosome partitioning protein
MPADTTRVIACAALKGGVGKSTTVANLAAVWGRDGRRVLALDLDPAFSLTRMFGRVPSNAPATAVELLTGATSLLDARIGYVIPGVDLIAGHRDLIKVELTLAGETGRERFLTRALDGQLDIYDVVILDTSPTNGLLTVNALVAATEVLIPVAMTDPGALQGLAETRAAAVQVAERLGARELAVTAVRTKTDPRRLTFAAIDDALTTLGVTIAEASIPLRAEFDNAATSGVPLALGRPDSPGAVAYWRLAVELAQPLAVTA